MIPRIALAPSGIISSKFHDALPYDYLEYQSVRAVLQVPIYRVSGGRFHMTAEWEDEAESVVADGQPVQLASIRGSVNPRHSKRSVSRSGLERYLNSHLQLAFLFSDLDYSSLFFRVGPRLTLPYLLLRYTEPLG